MKRIIFVPLLTGVLMLQGCSPISVKTDYDRRVDFNDYVTYKWMPYPEKRSKRAVPEGSFLDMRIRRAVESELLNKGYVLRESGQVDALIAYHVSVQRRVHVSYPYYGYWYPGPAAHAHSYREGTIVVDVVDPGKKQLIWRGTALGAVGSIDESEEKIDKAIGKIFERYPPN
jgi:hypothetical protein